MRNLRIIISIALLSAAILVGFTVAGSIPGAPLGAGTKADAQTVEAPDTPDLVSVKSNSVRKATVTWSAEEDTDGYEIYYKTGDDVQIRDVDEDEVSRIEEDADDEDELSVTLKDLKGGEKYKIKIRGYCLKGDKTKLRSSWSKARSVTIEHTKWTDLQDKYIEKKKVKQMIFVKYKGNSKARLILYKKVTKDSEAEETEQTADTDKSPTVPTRSTIPSSTTAGDDTDEETPEVTWKKVLACDAYVGQNGLDKVREGDRKTPTGVYPLTCAFGIKKDPGSKMDYTKVNKYHYWCGDSHYYNQMVDVRKQPHSCSGEHLIDYTKQYAYAMNIGYNKKGVTGKGSAIFLHCFGYNSYTLGCVAVSEENMKTILKTCGENTKICIYWK